MEIKNIQKLNTKDKMLIVKALIDIATKIKKDNDTFIINQLIKNGNYDSNYGKFYTQTIPAKTIQEVIDTNNAKIKKLQEENNELEKQTDKTAIAKDKTIRLMSKHSQQADNIANEILKTIIDNLDSRRLEKSASKTTNRI